MSKKKSKVTRKFYYYDISLMKRNSSNELEHIKNQETIFYDMFSHIENIQKNIKNGKVNQSEIEVSTDNGDKIFIIIDKNTVGSPIEFRLIFCREDALPLVENKGLLTFLTDFLPKNFSLAEITHCVIFPKFKIMGAEYNYSGAKASAIKSYLPLKYKNIDYVYCVNKLDSNMFSKLKPGKSFSLFSLSVRNNSKAMTELMNKNSIFRLLFTNIQNIETVEFSFKKKKGKCNPGFECPIPITEISDFIQNNRDDIKIFKVSQGSIQNDVVNLLHDKLVHVCELTKTINKAIDSEEAYMIIENFFNEKIKSSIH